MFSVTAEYALRAVMYLALHEGKPVTGRDIAEGTHSPVRYMSRVLRDLTSAGVLRAFRGPSGGFELARDAAEISVLDVVNVVDPIKRIERCPLGIETHGRNLCRLHKRLDESIAMMERTLAQSPITDLLAPSDEGSVPVTASVAIGAASAGALGRANGRTLR
ncbi:MAG: Rrf2 family transcriptional regulator [Phycisphaerales bacterium]|nr:Rrf2 family transcriptional regulator [Phycisphaerales bacterium]